MEVTTENVTPAKAEKWLNHNVGNRKLREGVAEQYSRCLQDGTWTECIDPIAFYEDGELADGQHRLWAIVDSGITMRSIIVRDLPRTAGLNIDTGLNRTLVDNARISGNADDLSNTLLATARAIEKASVSSKERLSNNEKLAFVERHREAAKWAIANGPNGRGLRNAITLAALARAWYHEEDKDKLRRWSDVLTTGHSEGAPESAAVSIRNYLQAKGPQAASSALWYDTFLKVQNSIRYFMLSRPLMSIKAIKDECYPLGKKPRAQSSSRSVAYLKEKKGKK